MSGCLALRTGSLLVVVFQQRASEMYCANTGSAAKKRKRCRQRKLSLHQLRNRRHIGSEEP
eukprot:1148623-Pelagomonas_calceolata.AAC.1